MDEGEKRPPLAVRGEVLGCNNELNAMVVEADDRGLPFGLVALNFWPLSPVGVFGILAAFVDDELDLGEDMSLSLSLSLCQHVPEHTR